jgi:Fe(II)/alpha-ketoglutarate-dependent arginine beta-hydroxylase
MYFILLASLFGDVFGWMSQQNGYIIHDILPIKGHESEEISSCSEGGLSLHTEDAFHPFRADYVGLMCLRNPGPIATTVASLDVSLLSRKQIEILRQPFFTIRPDLSHGRFTKDDTENESPRRAGCSECSTPYSYVPERVAVLFGDSQSPYMCLDPFFMDPSEHNDAALSALRALTESLERNTVDIYLGAGECCFIDNYRVLHGRRPFTPTYDVNERWLKRVNITRDLRKSRAMRQAVNSRIIY